MQYKFLHLPQEWYSSVDYLIESIPYWRELVSVLISYSAYKRMSEGSFLMQNGNIWVEEGTTINGVYYPSLSYELKQIKFDLWEILWIEYEGKKYEFSPKALSGEAAFITY